MLFNSAYAMPSVVSVNMLDLRMLNPAGYNVTEVFDGVSIGIKKPSDVIKVSVNPNGVFFGKATVLK